MDVRSIEEPLSGSVDFDEAFDGRGAWASVKSVAGKTFFNAANVDVSLTHEIMIRFDPAVSAETWLQLEDGSRVKIVDVENLEERREWQRLRCTERGSKTIEASKA